MTPNSLKPAGRLTLTATLATVLAWGPARAQEGLPPASPAPQASAPPAPAPLTPPPASLLSPFALHFKALLGLGTPSGSWGLELEVATGIFSLAAGVGGGSHGPQLAGTVRARTRTRPVFFDGGLGLSRGNYSRDGFPNCNPFSTRCDRDPILKATWTNVEVGAGLQAKAFHLRFYGGTGILSNPSTFELESTFLPYVGLSLGVSVSP